MTPEERVREYWRRVWCEGETAYAETFYAPTFRLNEAELTAAQWAAGAAAWQAKFDGFSATVLRMFPIDDGVVTQVRYQGRHTGDLANLPAAGRTFDVTGLDVFRFDGDRCMEHLHEADHFTMFEQLGGVLRAASE